MGYCYRFSKIILRDPIKPGFLFDVTWKAPEALGDDVLMSSSVWAIEEDTSFCYQHQCKLEKLPYVPFLSFPLHLPEDPRTGKTIKMYEFCHGHDRLNLWIYNHYTRIMSDKYWERQLLMFFCQLIFTLHILEESGVYLSCLDLGKVAIKHHPDYPLSLTLSEDEDDMYLMSCSSTVIIRLIRHMVPGSNLQLFQGFMNELNVYCSHTKDLKIPIVNKLLKVSQTATSLRDILRMKEFDVFRYSQVKHNFSSIHHDFVVAYHSPIVNPVLLTDKLNQSNLIQECCYLPYKGNIAAAMRAKDTAAVDKIRLYRMQQCQHLFADLSESDDDMDTDGYICTCTNDTDLLHPTLKMWSSCYEPDVIIEFQDAVRVDATPNRLGFRFDSFRSYIQSPSALVRGWFPNKAHQKSGEPVDPEGYGSQPSLVARYILLPDHTLIRINETIRNIRNGQNMSRLIGIPLYRVRYGNQDGQFGSGRVHGQSEVWLYEVVASMDDLTLSMIEHVRLYDPYGLHHYDRIMNEADPLTAIRQTVERFTIPVMDLRRECDSSVMFMRPPFEANIHLLTSLTDLISYRISNNMDIDKVQSMYNQDPICSRVDLLPGFDAECLKPVVHKDVLRGVLTDFELTTIMKWEHHAWRCIGVSHLDETVDDICGRIPSISEVDASCLISAWSGNPIPTGCQYRTVYPTSSDEDMELLEFSQTVGMSSRCLISHYVMYDVAIKKYCNCLYSQNLRLVVRQDEIVLEPSRLAFRSNDEILQALEPLYQDPDVLDFLVVLPNMNIITKKTPFTSNLLSQPSTLRWARDAVFLHPDILKLIQTYFFEVTLTFMEFKFYINRIVSTFIYYFAKNEQFKKYRGQNEIVMRRKKCWTFVDSSVYHPALDVPCDADLCVHIDDSEQLTAKTVSLMYEEYLRNSHFKEQVHQDVLHKEAYLTMMSEFSDFIKPQ